MKTLGLQDGQLYFLGLGSLLFFDLHLFFLVFTEKGVEQRKAHLVLSLFHETREERAR